MAWSRTRGSAIHGLAVAYHLSGFSGALGSETPGNSLSQYPIGPSALKPGKVPNLPLDRERALPAETNANRREGAAPSLQGNRLRIHVGSLEWQLSSLDQKQRPRGKPKRLSAASPAVHANGVSHNAGAGRPGRRALSPTPGDRLAPAWCISDFLLGESGES
jgi:hypothetical protein